MEIESTRLSTNYEDTNVPVEKKLAYPDDEVVIFKKELPENSQENREKSKKIENLNLYNFLFTI
jgi:hypothetical protein